jgi:drug/metabolite transporter, DME family
VRDRPLLVGSLVVVLAASGFGILGPLARFAYAAGLDPLSFVAWRAAFGLTVVLIVIAIRAAHGSRLVNPFRLPVADRIGLVAVGLAGLGLNVAMFFAFDLTSIAVALLAFYTYPALVAVAAAALGHERLDSVRLAALGLALAGMVLVVGGGLASGGAVTIHPLGVLLGLGAAVGQTIFVTVSRTRFRAVPSEQAMGWIIAIIAVGCALLALATAAPLGVVAERPDALAFALLGGIVGAGIPSTLFLVGIRAIGGIRAGILMLFEPLVGVTLAALLLHEALTPLQVLGGAAILGAALLIQRSSTPGEVTSVEPAGVPTLDGA